MMIMIMSTKIGMTKAMMVMSKDKVWTKKKGKKNTEKQQPKAAQEMTWNLECHCLYLGYNYKIKIVI